MFRYEFMILAFIAALLLGLCFPLIGSTAVYKRLSSAGDALAHSSLAGVAIGLVAGLNPLYVAIVSCVVSFLIIEFLRRKFGKHAEIGVVVVLSASIAIAGICSGYVSVANFDSYLFGSIVMLKKPEFIVVIVLCVVAVAYYFLTYNAFRHALYSRDEARISRIPVDVLDISHSILFSLTIAIGAKIVGSLVVSSMLVLPTAAALLLKKGYRFTAIASTIYSLLAMGGGIVLSYYLEWKPGATCVGLAVVLILGTVIYRYAKENLRKLRRKHSLE